MVYDHSKMPDIRGNIPDVSTYVKFTLPDRKAYWEKNEGSRLLVFNVKALLKEWHKSADLHLRYGDLTPEDREFFGEKVSRREAIGMPQIHMIESNDPRYNGLVDILDGRHRTTFLAEKGIREMPAMVPASDAVTFISRGLAREATKQETDAIKAGQFFPKSNVSHIASGIRGM